MASKGKMQGGMAKENYIAPKGKAQVLDGAQSKGQTPAKSKPDGSVPSAPHYPLGQKAPQNPMDKVHEGAMKQSAKKSGAY